MFLSSNYPLHTRFNVVAPAAPLRNRDRDDDAGSICILWMTSASFKIVLPNKGNDRRGACGAPPGTRAHLLQSKSSFNQIMVNNSTWQFRSTHTNLNNSCKFELHSSNPFDCDPSCLSFLPNQSSIGHPVFHYYHPTTSNTSTLFHVRLFYPNLITYSYFFC